jgi:hypothetical protein
MLTLMIFSLFFTSQMALPFAAEGKNRRRKLPAEARAPMARGADQV